MNHKVIYIFLSLTVIITLATGCQSSAITTSTVTTTPSHISGTPTYPFSTSLPVVLPSPEPTKSISGINPLTGLPPSDLSLLNRRPVVVKIENLPRNNRPQWGLSSADIVYEYHTEEGTTRFAAIFYGQNPEKIGPIRSARLFDIQLVQMYKGIFIFGSAYQLVFDQLKEADFADRLVIEGPNTYPALYRYDPDNHNFLLLDIQALQNVIDAYGIDNTPQTFEGMSFSEAIPENGLDISSIYIRYSGAIYNRWDYSPDTKKFIRFEDTEDDINRQEEKYAVLVDRTTQEPITADNVVMILAENYVVQSNIYDVRLIGKGKAYLARNGKLFEVTWARENQNDLLRLFDSANREIYLKPGHTWYEILSDPCVIEQEASAWRFTFIMPE